MSFDSGDASGWDECLPSVAGCTVETVGGKAEIPDHGDLWRVAWEIKGQGSGVRDQGSEVRRQAEASATLIGECFSLPLALERTLALTETRAGWKLSLHYTLTNNGSNSVPWSLVRASVVCRGSRRPYRVAGDDSYVASGRIGRRTTRQRRPNVKWPVADLTHGGQTDLSVGQAAESGIGDKLFAGPLNASQNWCALERPRAGVRIKVSFDPEAMPYLGLWICFGGWPERPGTKQMCVALEPTTAPVDSLAITGPWSRTLAPGASFSWPMEVEIESFSRVNRNA